jgi:hypothetical protein
VSVEPQLRTRWEAYLRPPTEIEQVGLDDIAGVSDGEIPPFDGWDEVGTIGWCLALLGA